MNPPTKRGGTIFLPANLVPKQLAGAREKAGRAGKSCESWQDYCQHFAAQDANYTRLELPPDISSRLFAHQRIGVDWMYHLFSNKMGGILGDDMGMGKTFQVVCLLIGLMKQGGVSKVLILAPVTVLPSWQREISTMLQPYVRGLTVEVMNSEVPKKKRIKILESVFQGHNPSVIVCSHQLVSTMTEEMTTGRWDYVILDEGHVIKNPQTKLSKSMHELLSHHRLLLTGTPIQNNLGEFWSLMNWATSGRCLGSIRQFNESIAEPINKGQNPKATDDQMYSASIAMRLLVKLCKPFLLQRKKIDHIGANDPLSNDKTSINIPEKKEFVVWISLSSQQKEEYKKFLSCSSTRSALSRTTYPVEVINTLKVLCRHPLLLEFAAMRKLGVGAVVGASGEEEDDDMDAVARAFTEMSVEAHKAPPKLETIFDLPDQVLNVHAVMKGSIKLRILVHMVRALVVQDHRVLVFSQSKLMLQIFQYLFAQFKLASYKIDGSTTYKERQSIIDDFNTPFDSYSGPRICLLTTKACGFGITLTGADRVIIYDPSWNPAEDGQAVDRAYRIGQTKPVKVYRFIHTGCLEQKIYEKQVFKEGLREVSEKGNETKRYFAGQTELKELLELEDDQEAALPTDKPRLFSMLRSNMDHLKEDSLIGDSADSMYGVQGVTRHDQLYPADSHAAPNKEPLPIRTTELVDLTQLSETDNLVSTPFPSKPRLLSAIRRVEAKIDKQNGDTNDNDLDVQWIPAHKSSQRARPPVILDDPDDTAADADEPITVEFSQQEEEEEEEEELVVVDFGSVVECGQDLEEDTRGPQVPLEGVTGLDSGSGDENEDEWAPQRSVGAPRRSMIDDDEDQDSVANAKPQNRGDVFQLESDVVDSDTEDPPRCDCFLEVYAISSAETITEAIDNRDGKEACSEETADRGDCNIEAPWREENEDKWVAGSKQGQSGLRPRILDDDDVDDDEAEAEAEEEEDHEVSEDEDVVGRRGFDPDSVEATSDGGTLEPEAEEEEVEEADAIAFDEAEIEADEDAAHDFEGKADKSEEADQTEAEIIQDGGHYYDAKCEVGEVEADRAKVRAEGSEHRADDRSAQRCGADPHDDAWNDSTTNLVAISGDEAPFNCSEPKEGDMALAETMAGLRGEASEEAGAETADGSPKCYATESLRLSFVDDPSIVSLGSDNACSNGLEAHETGKDTWGEAAVLLNSQEPLDDEEEAFSMVSTQLVELRCLKATERENSDTSNVARALWEDVGEKTRPTTAPKGDAKSRTLMGYSMPSLFASPAAPSFASPVAELEVKPISPGTDWGLEETLCAGMGHLQIDHNVAVTPQLALRETKHFKALSAVKIVACSAKKVKKASSRRDSFLSMQDSMSEDRLSLDGGDFGCDDVM